MKIRALIFSLWLLGLVLAMAGCSSDNNGSTAGVDPYTNPDGTPVTYARFDAIALPLPNDVAWGNNKGVCPNGQVCLPLSAGETPTDGGMGTLKSIVNAQALPGLSPNMFLTIPVTGPVDLSTLDFLVFRLDDTNLSTLLGALAANNLPAAGAAFAALEKYTENDFILATGTGAVKLLPKKPFNPGGSYAVVVHSTLMDGNNNLVQSGLTMEALKQTTPFGPDSPFLNFEALRAKYNDDVSPTEPALFTVTQGVTAVANGGIPWSRADTLVLWTFQTADRTLDLNPTATIGYPDGVTDPFNDSAANFKLLSATTNTAPSLIWIDKTVTPPVDSASPVGIPAGGLLSGTGIPFDHLGNIYFGQFLSPVLTGGTDSVSFLVSVPDSLQHPMPVNGYPVVVFQHGITSSKNAALPIANALAKAGYATLAIDAPYHGDRTLPDMTSGDGFFTANLIQDRANIYKAALDLWETVDLIEAGIDLDGIAGADLDAGNVGFVAHSLGSIIGSVFLSQEDTGRVDRMVLSSPSALLVNVLDETALPDLQALVASLGYTAGTTPYFIFLDLAQWLLDPTDSSYAGIGGNDTGNLLTVMAYGDPIVSTDSTRVFLSNIGVDTVTTVDPEDFPATFPTVAGDFAAGAYEYGLEGKPVVHSFLLDPTVPADEPWYTGYNNLIQQLATGAAQTQVAGFLAP
ncbi:hypothetical protein JCM30471_06910 [Desulfuromonas carbonis]|uniref:alpha/beta fold hydrolase n=1 Tax=Desulfuromonas sp. DDH964 TaxID=1823759 RepID=UPI00078EC23D|nr:alpha/beta fold hydrolase [Desulfuromonas sp. DDH964]AMV72191.1 hypothetical protein DBW_1835 [Desulfuromonas sp. DDH964]